VIDASFSIVVMKIAHIVNPVNVPLTSILGIAQPITFETMRTARNYAVGQVDVDLYTAQFPEDHPAVPDDFMPTPDLDRSVLDMGSFQQQRKLPLLRDILDRLYHSAVDADYLIYTNADIALMPHFYVAVQALLQEGYDAISITRRTIPNRYTTTDQLIVMMAEVGINHPGHDCFIFRRDVYPLYQPGGVCIGARWVGLTLIWNLALHAQKFEEFTDKHLTFHIGDDQAWNRPELADYVAYNRREARQVQSLLAAQFSPSKLESILRRFPLEEVPARPFFRKRLARLVRRAANRISLLLDNPGSA
jgi:hypothetical protein